MDESGNSSPVAFPWQCIGMSFTNPSDQTALSILLRDESGRELEVLAKTETFVSDDYVPNTSRLSNEAFRISIALEEQVFSYSSDKLPPAVELH